MKSESMPLCVLLAIACLFLQGMAQAAGPTPAARMTGDNPLIAGSNLDLLAPEFDRIEEWHYLPAFEEALRRQRAGIDAITGNPEPPSFDNTIVALERSGQLLQRASSLFFGMTTANTSQHLDSLLAEINPRLESWTNEMRRNEKLHGRIHALYQQRSALGLDPESAYLLEHYHAEFVLAGAELPEAGKKKLQAIDAELNELGARYYRIFTREKNDSAVVVDSRAELAGLSESAIFAAGNAARAHVLKDKYVIELANTTEQPILELLDNRDLREKIMRASLARGSRGGESDATGLVVAIAKLRAERAQLLGYPNHAATVLESQMAASPDAVNRMIAGLAPKAVAAARREAVAIQVLMDSEAPGLKLESWDWAYYSRKLRAARSSFDASELMPYLEMENVLKNGVFHAAEQLYGLSFRERSDLPVYDPRVRVFEVLDKDGKTLALFYADHYQRRNKRGGAWMTDYVSQSRLLGTRAVVASHMNLPVPAPGSPGLMTWDEVETMFHIFGYALHSMLSDVNYPRFAGSSVPRDFQTHLSQVNAMWAAWPSVIAHYARHYQTGAAVPQALLDGLQARAKDNQGFATTEYLAAALLDQRWHQLTPDQVPTAADAMAFEAKALHEAGLDFTPVPPRYRGPYFAHLWAAGHDAGYYSYIWNETLDADSQLWFKQHGGLNRGNGDHSRATLLSRGGSRNPMEMFRDFTGHEPRLEPLLVRRGLQAEPAK